MVVLETEIPHGGRAHQHCRGGIREQFAHGCALRKLRNAFAHSAESASLADPAHGARLAEIVAEARINPLWALLETVLAAQPPSAHGPLEPALRDYILLVTILVAFLEATAQQLRPYQPPVVMGFSGVIRQAPAC